MKKYHLYLWIVALVGLMTACSQDEAAGPQTYEPTNVTLSASVNRSIQTRAITMPNNCKLRYILEVWTTGENPVLKLRKEELKEDFSGVDFTFNLTDAADYNALLWADFIQTSVTIPTTQTISGVECDHYQDLNFKTTDNLKNIIRTPAGAIPTLHNDAFCACHPISKKTGAYSGNVQLVRPFGQINIIEKDANALAKVSQTKAVFNVPKGYNVENGMPTSETEEATKTATFYPLSSSKNDCTANLFYDYIFAPATGQTTLGEIKLTFTSSDNTLQIGDFTIPANMPVERNKRTNISGHIVSVSDAPSDAAKLSVTVSDNWEETTDGDYDVDALVWDGTSTSKPADYNSGSPGEVSITTAAELAWLAKQQNIFRGYTFKLTADIDLNNREWTPIGSTYTFNGNFDGQGHTVSNLKCTNSKKGGLFAEIINATVKDVTVSGSVSFNTDNESSILGGIVAQVLDNSTITGCTNRCTISTTGDGNQGRVGGIAGYVANQGNNCNFTISSNTNTGNVSTNGNESSSFGGIIGAATATNSNSITLTGNNYDGGTPSDVCIGYCVINSSTITIDGTGATNRKPYPVPKS